MERMKSSKYNIFFDADDGTHLGFNGITGALASFDEVNWLKVKRINEDPNSIDWNTQENIELKESLLEGFFILDESLDEIDLMKIKLNMGRYANNEWVMSICPTLNCNFACPYCYEGEEIKVPGRMSQEIVESTISFLGKKLPGIRTLRIIWYGGEPLLEFETIKGISERLIQKCAEQHCTYVATMITNGYLLTPDISKQLAELAVCLVQVTIDPPKACHDSKRKLRSGGGTYEKVITNAYTAAEHISELYIRLNVDKENLRYAFDFLEEPIFRRKNVRPSLGRLAPITKHCADIGDLCLTAWEHHEWIYKFNKKCRDLGINIGAVPYPPVSLGYCMSDGISGFAVDPMGKVYKCIEMVGEEEEIVGFMKDGELRSNRNLLRWQLWDPFADPNCRACNILPICRGGCPNKGLRGLPLQERCSGWKYAFLEKLRDFYAASYQPHIERR